MQIHAPQLFQLTFQITQGHRSTQFKQMFNATEDRMVVLTYLCWEEHFRFLTIGVIRKQHKTYQTFLPEVIQ